MQLLDREAELQRFEVLLGEVSAGSGRLAVIEGPAGIGKSALLDEICATAGRANSVLRARCGEFERDFAFGVARQLVEPVIRAAAGGEDDRLLAGPASLAAAALTDPLSGPPVDDFQLFHSLYWMCVNLASAGPLVLAVDDAQWADASSLKWLRYLARRSEDVPVLIVLAARTDEVDDANATLDDLVRAPSSAEIVLAPLSEDSTACVLEQSLGRPPDGALLDASYRATGGNPFLVTEVARALGDNDSLPAGDELKIDSLRPQSIVRSIDARLRRLPGPAQALARAATVFGMEVDFRHAAALAGLTAAAAAEAADTLYRAGILDCVDPLRFEHSLTREAIFCELPPAGLAHDHKRAAEILAAEGAPADRVAGHLLVTTPVGDQWSAHRLRDAAEVALQLGAPASAITYLQRALAEPPAPADRWPLLWMLGRAELLTASPAAAQHLQEALEKCGDPARRPLLAGELADGLARVGRAGDAYRVLDEVIAAVGPENPELALHLEARLLGVSQLDHAVATRARGRVDSLTHLRGETIGERMVLAIVAYIRANDGSPQEEVLRLGHLACEGGRGLSELSSDDLPRGSTHLAGNVFGLLSRALATLGEIETATEILRILDADASARGSIFMHMFARLARGVLSYTVGDIAAAREDAETALGLARESGSLAAVPVAAALAVAAAMERGEHDAVLQLLDGLGLSGPLPPMGVLDVLLFYRGVLRGELGYVDDGLEDLFELGRRARTAGYELPLIQWRVAAAPLLSAVGRGGEARSLLGEEIDISRRRGAVRPLALALRASGVLEGGEPGLELLGEAAGLLESSPFRLESARTEIEFGAALRRANRRTEARGHLELGLQLAFRCGATPLAVRARAELSAAGARPRRLFVTGPQSLTASERRVAELAGAGRSNPDIAQALFVTRKTVETHLGRVYQKLSISSRSELKDALHL